MSIQDVRVLIAELLDGSDVAFVRRGQGSLMDFVTGKIDECPFVFRFEPRGEDGEEATPAA